MKLIRAKWQTRLEKYFNAVHNSARGYLQGVNSPPVLPITDQSSEKLRIPKPEYAEPSTRMAFEELLMTQSVAKLVRPGAITPGTNCQTKQQTKAIVKKRSFCCVKRPDSPCRVSKRETMGTVEGQTIVAGRTRMS